MDLSQAINEMMEDARRRDAIPTIINDHAVSPRAEGKPFNALWVVTAAFAHPAWSQYFVSLCDLTTPTAKPPVIARPGMSHEMMVYAIDPAKPVKLWADHQPSLLLQPANHGYQFPAANDDAALKRVQAIIDAVVERRFSPDTDYTRAWDEIFRDGVSLKINVFERLGASVQ